MRRREFITLLGGDGVAAGGARGAVLGQPAVTSTVNLPWRTSLAFVWSRSFSQAAITTVATQLPIRLPRASGTEHAYATAQAVGRKPLRLIYCGCTRSMGDEGRATCGGRLRRLVPNSIANDPAHWRKRAEEMRTLANEIKDPLSKETMLRIADDYERLAKRAEARAIGQRPN